MFWKTCFLSQCCNLTSETMRCTKKLTFAKKTLFRKPLMFCYVHKSSEKCYFFFCKKKCIWLVTFCKHQLQKALQFFQWWWEKKVKRGPKKKCRFTEKRLFYTCDDNVELVPANVIFFGQSTKGIFGCTSESFVCKKDWVENASSYQPFPSFQWFEPLNVFLTFFGKNMSNATASTASLTPIIKHYFCSCC